MTRAVAALTLAAVAGFLLGACGGGGGTEAVRTTRTGVTVTRPATTATEPSVPTRTVPSPTPPTTTSVTVETTTIDITTTVPVEPTTRPPLTITVAPPTTTAPTTTPTTTTTPAVAAPPTTTVSTEPTSSSTETPWGWIALVLALTGAVILGIVLWTRSRTRGRTSAQIDELERRTLVALDDVLASGSLVTGQVQALAAEARSLERGSSDQRARRLRGGLDELAATLEADRTLRFGTPPPSQEQLTYSTALVRQQVEQLQGALRAPPAA